MQYKAILPYQGSFTGAGRSWLLLLLVCCLCPGALLADEAQLSLVVQGGTWTIKNASCSAFVVAVDRRSYCVGSNSEVLISAKKWKQWWWMPGALSGVQAKEVLHPLRSNIKVSYGPGSVPTHTGADHYSYDFPAPEGTEVYAMERGVVIKVVDRYDVPHRDLSRRKETNSIKILHEDGTVAGYSHLQKGSMLFKECDRVDALDVIALSGNTGYSSGPHLHVDVYKPLSGRKYKNLPVEFLPR